MNKISVKAVVIRDNKVLLLKPKNLQGSFKGWDGPGGHVEKGELILDALKREVFEETRLKIDKAYPVKILNISGIGTEYLVFLCTTFNNDITLSLEHTEYSWLDMDSFNEILGKYLIDDLRELRNLITQLIT
ncbi:hypothetical protein COV89_02450 [Candidatus Shapirobacteria bacterium CG11_big_fil_rev_8_21_14_0_20_40_12]|uniref:Nudix hydrolase domain-containing protein n=1 Tax=Candidatus Shapirobacteria bacterium CG11_big_fil_rev_8_21_14_0_20_40_12 TaxID=1974889 RepID=A0A2H0KFP7_9BACT|nr:MAG: hypothetical protein COV89_02450 [Candidatus Shapirobacteria bacterium CG11_big_fil_rev_8_21_14_0_20_40_12]